MTAKYRKLLKKHIACLICIIMMAASVPATVCAGEKADDEKTESIRSISLSRTRYGLRPMVQHGMAG